MTLLPVPVNIRLPVIRYGEIVGRSMTSSELGVIVQGRIRLGALEIYRVAPCFTPIYDIVSS
jgi:hypothetical protein